MFLQKVQVLVYLCANSTMKRGLGFYVIGNFLVRVVIKRIFLYYDIYTLLLKGLFCIIVLKSFEFISSVVTNKSCDFVYGLL